jgi:hypothetical protein
MNWYKSLTRQQKVHIRECFELATGIPLNKAIQLFTFSECMDLLESKLKIEGIL